MSELIEGTRAMEARARAFYLEHIGRAHFHTDGEKSRVGLILMRRESEYSSKWKCSKHAKGLQKEGCGGGETVALAVGGRRDQRRVPKCRRFLPALTGVAMCQRLPTAGVLMGCWFCLPCVCIGRGKANTGQPS